MSLMGRGHQEEEVMQALANYLEIVENGGDGQAFLRRHGGIEPELRALAALDTGLHFEMPEEMFAGQERSRHQFLAAVKDDDTTVRALAWFKPRLFGIIGALGLGMGLTGAFASGALPSQPLASLIRSLPVVGSASSSPSPPNAQERVNPGVDGYLNPLPLQGAPIFEKQDSTQTAETAWESETPTTSSPQSSPEAIEPRGVGTNSPSPAAGNGGAAGSNNGGSQGQDSGIGSKATPPGQAGENPGQGVAPEGTPPGQGGENPGQGGSPDGTPPGEDGEVPGEGQGPPEDPGPPPGAGGPPENPGGQGNGNNGNPGQGVGPDGTPPGQGGDNPGQGNGPGGTPPGQDGDNPAQGNGPTEDPGGQGDQGNGPPDNPGQGNGNGPPDDPGDGGTGPPGNPVNGGQGNENSGNNGNGNQNNGNGNNGNNGNGKQN